MRSIAVRRRAVTVWRATLAVVATLMAVTGCGQQEWSYRYAPGETYAYTTGYDITGHLRVMGLDLPISGSSEGQITVTGREGEGGRVNMDVDFTQRVRLNDPTGQGNDLDEEVGLELQLTVDKKGNLQVVAVKNTGGLGELDPLMLVGQSGMSDNTAWVGPVLPQDPPGKGDTWTVDQRLPLPNGKTLAARTTHTFTGYQTIDGVEYAVIKSRVELKAQLQDLLTDEQAATLPAGVESSISLTGETTSYIGRESWVLEWAEQVNQGTILFQGTEPQSGLPISLEMEVEMRGGLKRRPVE